MNEIKNSNKGFTLIELLVVVLIIGILAAIALPQYKMAVGKAKLSAVKDTTKAIADAEELYYVQNGKYTNDPSKLDIDFTGLSVSGTSLYFQNGSYCYIWNSSSEKGQRAVACRIYVGKQFIQYYQHFVYSSSPNRKSCYASSKNKTDIVNRICQSESGKTANQANCSNDACSYNY